MAKLNGTPWPALIIGLLALLAFALGQPAALYPMDDAYIHFVYARNLAELGRLTFNTVAFDPGVGTSSILWTLLLTLAHWTIGITTAARLLGGAAYLACVLLAWHLGRQMAPAGRPAAPTLCACLVALSGNLLWFSLSGMETMLFAALALGAIAAYGRRLLPLAGLLAGLCALCRIEGVLVLLAVLAVELVRERAVRRPMVVAGLLAAVLLGPWLAVLKSKTGHFLPTTFEGKKQAQVRAALEVVRDVTGAEPSDDGRLPWWTAGIYPLGALGYGVAFVMGAAYLPGPRLRLEGQLFEMIGGLSWLGLFLAAALFLPLLALGAGRAARAIRGPDDARRRALTALAVWVILHNLAYWAKLPTPGTASRYQVVNHLAFWLLCGAAVWWWRTSRERQLGVVTVLCCLAVANGGFWRGVYLSNLRHMGEVRQAAAEWIRDHTPPGSVVAAHDIGMLGWAMERRCLDLGGLIDPAWLAYRRAGRTAEFFAERGATYLVLPTKHSSEATGFYDYAAALGLDRAAGVSYEPLRSFENDHASWLRGAAPTWNALPAVTVYRLHAGGTVVGRWDG